MNWNDLVGDWHKFLLPILKTNYFMALLEHLTEKYSSGAVLFPKSTEIFEPFRLCPFEKLKVVIIGEQPYRDGKATGLPFANRQTEKDLSPALFRISEAVKKTVYDNYYYPFDKTLKVWAEQGILLLNGALTHEEGALNSHIPYWNPFIRSLLIKLNDEYPGLIYMLWGTTAVNFSEFISNPKNHIMKATNPCVSLTIGEPWDCDHFMDANSILIEEKQYWISW